MIKGDGAVHLFNANRATELGKGRTSGSSPTLLHEEIRRFGTKSMKRKELLAQMPKNKSDTKAAEAIVRLGYPEIEPVMFDMLLWLRVHDSPVASIFANFFANLSPQPVHLIAKFLGKKSETLREGILTNILPAWPREAVMKLKNDLTTYATHPGILNNDISCFRMILKHDLADRAWVRQWLEFRKEQAIDRVNQFEQLEKEMESTSGALGRG
jgi:hypothetical protein